MKNFLQSVRRLLSGDSLSETFTEPAGEPDWKREIAERSARYHSVMLGRIARFSDQHKNSVQVPERLFHASLHGGLTALDPELGQGLGVWFQDDLVEAAHFIVSRNTQPSSRAPYPDTSPSIYEVSLNVKKFAIFPDELSLYRLAIEEPGDDQELKLKPAELYDLHNVRRALAAAGYDGIHLLKENTYSVLDSQAITILSEQDPFPIYNTHVRPKLSMEYGDPFPWVPQ